MKWPDCLQKAWIWLRDNPFISIASHRDLTLPSHQAQSGEPSHIARCKTKWVCLSICWMKAKLYLLTPDWAEKSHTTSAAPQQAFSTATICCRRCSYRQQLELLREQGDTLRWCCDPSAFASAHRTHESPHSEAAFGAWRSRVLGTVWKGGLKRFFRNAGTLKEEVWLVYKLDQESTDTLLQWRSEILGRRSRSVVRNGKEEGR